MGSGVWLVVGVVWVRGMVLVRGSWGSRSGGVSGWWCDVMT